MNELEGQLSFGDLMDWWDEAVASGRDAAPQWIMLFTDPWPTSLGPDWFADPS